MEEKKNLMKEEEAKLAKNKVKDLLATISVFEYLKYSLNAWRLLSKSMLIF